jgi:hypothetical protein
MVSDGKRKRSKATLKAQTVGSRTRLLASESGCFDAESRDGGLALDPGEFRPLAIPPGYERLDFLCNLLVSQVELHCRLTELSVRLSLAELARRRSR